MDCNTIVIRVRLFFRLYLIVAHTIPKIHKYDVDKKVQIFTKYCKKRNRFGTPKDMTVIQMSFPCAVHLVIVYMTRHIGHNRLPSRNSPAQRSVCLVAFFMAVVVVHD